MMHHDEAGAVTLPLGADDTWVWPLMGPELERYLATCEPSELRTLVRELTADLATTLARYVPADHITQPAYAPLRTELDEAPDNAATGGW